MYKIVPVGSWDFGVEPSSLIKFSRDGLRGEDRDSLFKKRAASERFAEVLARGIEPGDIPIHTIAIGATEYFGANRNGDGFCVDTCRKHASSFVGRPLREFKQGQHNGARYFINHKNQDPEQSYGYAKAAIYNEDMGRIELLILANGTKEAAERNGGLVLPAEVKEALYTDKLIGGSMACPIFPDGCSICPKKTASRQTHCDESSCIGPDGVQGFGCKAGLTKLLKSGRQQFVENPNPRFFDFSKVSRPADRTAYGGMVSGVKAAVQEHVLGGAAMAESYGLFPGLGGISLFETPLDRICRKQLQLVYKLAAIEEELDQGLTASDKGYLPGCDSRLEIKQAAATFGPPGSDRFRGGLTALAERKISLSLRDFCQLFSPDVAGEKVASAVENVEALLPSVYRRLRDDPFLDAKLAASAAAFSAGTPSNFQRKFAEIQESSASYNHTHTLSRALRSCWSSRSATKIAAAKSVVETPSLEVLQLAESYAIYKLAFLVSQPEDRELPLTLRLSLLQNRLQHSQ